MTARRSRKSSSVQPDQCYPPEMVEVLLSRLKKCELDESKKSLLCVELNDLLWFFEKHPKSVGMFRSDLIEWRSFLKQSKAYMDDLFDKKMARTKRIMDYVLGKPKSVKSNVKQPPQPSYYQVLFRPGIRSVRQYPINVEHYGEHNANIDQLHRKIATLREEIIYAPQAKMSCAEKRVMLDILLSIVEICAYDVLDGVGFLKEMGLLINGIVEGEEFRKKTNIVGYMSSLASKLKEKAKCHWMQGNDIKRKMWEDIASIERKLDLDDKPKFDLELLSKSSFLRMEKMKEMVADTADTKTGASSEDVKKQETEEKSQSFQDVSSISESKAPELSSVSAIAEEDKSPIKKRGCEKGDYRQDIVAGVHFQEVDSDECIPCGSSTANICSTKGRVIRSPKEKPLEEPAVSPVLEWANDIIGKYGPACQCSIEAEGEDICEDKGVKYVPDAAHEDETLFKYKKYPRPRYGILKHVTLPPAPKDTDNNPLIDILRVELDDDQDEQMADAAEPLPSDINNPYLGRTRLLKY